MCCKLRSEESISPGVNTKKDRDSDREASARRQSEGSFLTFDDNSIHKHNSHVVYSVTAARALARQDQWATRSMLPQHYENPAHPLPEFQLNLGHGL